MDERLSVGLIAALARVWTSIRSKHPAVPGVVILAAPGARDQPRVLGHFAALRWSAKENSGKALHEVVVVAEYLNRPAEDVVETLLHEAAHAMNFDRGIKDCSRSQYHNARFKVAAEEVGLTVEQVPHAHDPAYHDQGALRRGHRGAPVVPYPPAEVFATSNGTGDTYKRM